MEPKQHSEQHNQDGQSQSQNIDDNAVDSIFGLFGDDEEFDTIMYCCVLALAQVMSS